VSLEWQPVTYANGIDHYDWVLQRSLSGLKGSYSAYESGQATGTSVQPGRSCGNWYRWRVRAVGLDSKVGDFSTWAYFVIGID
jgi:hypothetical protein